MAKGDPIWENRLRFEEVCMSDSADPASVLMKRLVNECRGLGKDRLDTMFYIIDHLAIRVNELERLNDG